MAPNGGGHILIKSLVDVSGRELEIERLRIEIAIVLSPHIFAYLGHEAEPVSLVVDDVLAGWLRRRHEAGNQPTALPEFVDEYTGQIEWERGSDGNEMYRAEFCRDDEPADDDPYFHRVWKAHVQRLRERV